MGSARCCLVANKGSNFRPISLITNLYKILVKVLVNRLGMVLSSTISLEQRAFAEVRQVLDASLIANEVVEDARRSCKKGGESL